MTKTYYLKFSESYEQIDDSNTVAAFMGRFMLGKVVTDEQSQSIFDNLKAVEIQQLNFFQFCTGLRRSLDHFQSKPDETFILDIQKPNKNRKYKLVCSFGPPSENADVSVTFRYLWNWKNDDNFLKDVKEGKRRRNTHLFCPIIIGI